MDTVLIVKVVILEERCRIIEDYRGADVSEKYALDRVLVLLYYVFRKNSNMSM